MKLSAIVRALTARGISEEVAKSAVLDVEDHSEDSGLGGGRQTGFPTAPGRGAHGFDAERQIAMSSDLAPQGERQREYEATASMLSETVRKAVEAAMKTAQPATTAKAEDEGYLPRVEKALKDAKKALIKAEDDDEDEDEESVEKAVRLIEKAKKLLAKAEEEDEDEEKVEKARTTLKAVRKSLKTLQDDRAVAAKAKADAATALEAAKAAETLKVEAVKAEEKSEKQEDDEKKADDESAKAVTETPELVAVKGQVEMLTASLKDVMDALSNMSRNAVKPPIMKSATTEPVKVEEPNYVALIAHEDDAGNLSLSERITARRIANHLHLAKSGGDMETVKQEIAGAAASVRKIFEPVLKAA